MEKLHNHTETLYFLLSVIEGKMSIIFLFFFLVCIILVLLYMILESIKRRIKVVVLSAVPIEDETTQRVLIDLVKSLYTIATVFYCGYYSCYAVPVAHVKGCNLHVTMSGVAIEKKFSPICEANIIFFLTSDKSDIGVGFNFSYGHLTQKRECTNPLQHMMDILRLESNEINKRVSLLEKKLETSTTSEEEKAVCFISREVYSRRLIDNSESISLLDSYIKKKREGLCEKILDSSIVTILGYDDHTGKGIGSKYTQHFLDVCKENPILFKGPFRRYWQGNDCGHYHKMDGSGCVTGMHASKFQSNLEVLSSDMPIIPYSYNLIRVLEDFKDEIDLKLPVFNEKYTVLFKNPPDYKGTVYEFPTHAIDLGSIWSDLVAKKGLLYDICIQDSLAPESELDFTSGIKFRVFGLLFLFGLNYLGNGSSIIYFEGVRYIPFLDFDYKSNYFPVGSNSLLFKKIYLKKRFKYKNSFLGVWLEFPKVKKLKHCIFTF